MSLYSDIIRNLQTTFANELSSYTVYFDDNIPDSPADHYINIKFQLINDFEQKTTLTSSNEASFYQDILIVFECRQKMRSASAWRYDAVYNIQEVLNKRNLLPIQLNPLTPNVLFNAKSATSKDQMYDMAVIEAPYQIISRRSVSI
ncbi:hypothetical protein [Francisella marina]|uniref:hypothetical protein n=1 Tax=Francisella marina TaxID=2249302 RepID=UPI0011EDA218|nr:hypothetical protein [Francisella marina]QEO58323.1 hypothetical protein F0R75_00500 [Francisella marina]